MHNSENNPDTSVLKTALEIDRLRLERSKLAIETRLKRKEVAAHSQPPSKSALSNPLVLAVLGGSLTLLTSIVTNGLTTRSNREASENSASLSLQSDLIKTFLTDVDTDTANDNLLFLVKSGLIPNYENNIKKFRKENPNAKPGVSSSAESIKTQAQECPPLNLGKNPASRNPDDHLNVSIHLGNNQLDPRAYGGWSGDLRGAVADAVAMQKLAASGGFQTNLFVDASSRWEFLSQWLDTLAATLRAGDTFLITQAGNGTRVKDQTGDDPDGWDENWLVYDQQVCSAQIYDKFLKFRAGVKIIVVQDSCNAAPFRERPKSGKLKADLIVVAACKEDQFSAEAVSDGTVGGLFTSILVKTWDNGNFHGGYNELLSEVSNRFEKNIASQTPQLYVYGSDSGALAAERPFATQTR